MPMSNAILQYWRKFVQERSTPRKQTVVPDVSNASTADQDNIKHISEYQHKVNEADQILRDLQSLMTQSKQQKSRQEHWSNVVELPEGR